MANNLAVNPIFVDSTGVVVARPCRVKAISIRASADAWVVVLNNVRMNEGTARAGGVINFDQAQSIVNDRGGFFEFGGEGQAFDGIWALTLTNITDILVYLA